MWRKASEAARPDLAGGDAMNKQVPISRAVPLWGVMVGFLTYEACVGMYFPAIGTLRSKYVPNENKSVILSLFGIPLNLLVVAIYLSIKQLGTTGALAVSAGALVIATGCMAKLRNVSPDGLVQP